MSADEPVNDLGIAEDVSETAGKIWLPQRRERALDLPGPQRGRCAS
jgi:hypothetical protein